MASRKHFIPNGFTLIEILLVSALSTAIAASGIVYGLDTYRGYLFRTERDTLVHVLGKARSRALSNMYQTVHGVHIEGAAYVLFRGGTYHAGDPSNEQIPKSTLITITTPGDITFDQLSGDANTAGNIVLHDGIRSAIISINHEGLINW